MRKTHADKIREAVTDLRSARASEIIDWIRRHYPGESLNPRSYRADIIGCSINHSSSHHYPALPKFLWFEKDSKEYRLAEPKEAPISIQIAETKPSTSESEIEYIGDIAVGKLSVTGQVSIPLKIREELGLKPGHLLAFVINDDGVLEVRKARIRVEFG
jgi:AbrB family looped-hinge helix DNA binding protein